MARRWQATRYNSATHPTSQEFDENMPVVHIHMFEGRTDDQKSAIVKGVTKAISEAAGIPDSATTVVIHDTKRSNWAEGGVLASEA